MPILVQLLFSSFIRLATLTYLNQIKILYFDVLPLAEIMVSIDVSSIKERKKNQHHEGRKSIHANEK